LFHQDCSFQVCAALIIWSPLLYDLQDGSYDLSAAPPFNLSDIRNAIPAHCWEKNSWRSMAHLALDVGIVAGLAAGAFALNAW